MMERFRDLIDIHGSDIDRWPVEDRETARHLLATEPAARAVKAEAEWLESMLARIREPVPADAAARILNSLASLPPQKRWRFAGLEGLFPMLPQLATLVAIACLGVLIGVSDIDAVLDGSRTDVSTLALDIVAPVDGAVGGVSE